MKRFFRWLSPVVCFAMLLTGCKSGDTTSSSNGSASSGSSAVEGADMDSFTGLNNHVAGSKGFVEVRDGHFYVGDERIRFFGVSVCSAAAFPTKETAEQMAEDLARHGVNCVRLHHMDWPGDEMIFEDFRDNTLELDAEKLDRMDYFVYQLEQHGIYINFNTHVSRQYAENDGMPEYDKVGFAGKYINYFDDKALELQKDYARKLYDRVNPYTGKKYAEDPGVAMIEITNENWMVLGWTQGYLHPGTNTGADKSTWSLPPYYLKELDAAFNGWLKEKYGTTARLLEAWTDNVYDESVYEDVGELKGVGSTYTLEKGNIPRMTWKSKDSYPDKVLQDNAEFYTTLEMDYYQEMLDYLKNDLGIKVPMTTTNGYFSNPSLYAQTLGDFTDTHYYLDTLGDKWHSFEMSNISIVRDNASADGVYTAQNQWIAGPALSKVKGKPMTVSEYNLPFPSKYEYEGLPVLTAYALYQDWDGLFLFSYTGALKENEIGAMITLDSSLDVVHNPMKMSQMAMCAQMFIRGDIQPAQEVITAQYGIGELYEMLNTGRPWAYNNGWTWSFDLNGNFPVTAVYKYRFEKEFINGTTSSPEDLFKNGDYQSLFKADEFVGSGEELIWYNKADANYIRINTPMTQGAVGFVSGKTIETDDFSFQLDHDGSVLASSRTSDPLSSSKDIFINLAMQQENMGQIMNNKGGIDPGNWGTAPVLQHKAAGTIRIKTSQTGTVNAVAVDRMGKKIKDLSAAIADGWLTIDLDGVRTNYIYITIS